MTKEKTKRENGNGTGENGENKKVGQPYFVPSLQITVYASSLEEALKKAQKMKQEKE